MSEIKNTGRRQQVRALMRVAKYRPLSTVAIIVGGILAALFEGVGLSFILPIVETVQASGDPAQQADGVLGLFVSVYQFLGVPFALKYVVTGVSLVLTVRWTLTFVVRWLRGVLVVDYTREIQTQAFDNALSAKVAYFDQEGSDDILNAIITQARYAGRLIKFIVDFIEQGFLALMYLGVAFALAPILTLSAVLILGGISLLFRHVIESGYSLGDRVASANERVQQTTQAGTRGIRDTKLFDLKQELFEEFLGAVNEYAKATITHQRNQQAIQNFYNLLTAILVFVLIYLAIVFAEMSLASLGVFLFAMFRVAPKASGLNSTLYQIENNLPHLVRTQDFIKELEENSEPAIGTEPVPDEIQSVEFNDIRFSYDVQDEAVLTGVSFELKKAEFIGFVGQSGAGKSTIISLLTRMYEPDSGYILANGRPIDEMDIEQWRSRIAVVRQSPFIFNDTLRYNLTIGNRDVPKQELDRVCHIAKVTEFFDDMPEGYDTQLGDDGEITETGCHDSLINRGGQYAELYAIQSGSE